MALARLLGVDDQFLARQFLDRQRCVGAGQAAAGRDRKHQALFAQHRAFDRGVVAADAAEADVDAFGLERLDLLDRQEEGRVWKESVCSCRYRWSQYHEKKKQRLTKER